MASIDTTKFLFVVAVATAAYVFLSPLLISAWIHSDSGNYENTVSTEAPPAMVSGCYTTIVNISRGDGEEYGIPANGTEAGFGNIGYEVIRFTDADLRDLPTVNETIQTGIQEVLIPYDEVERIVEYRGKIAEYHGSYYLIDFCKC